ncbi:hypothetical protein [Salirhabdus sp. Marseille-P4669]|uniref:hypothetical protein n=1 Tax=Salirhabdus sp. Marseille-P4669 TaxID=2042310 RepID=UPI0013582D0E|nr:hypothetical protein [Salirhabdus sp. Marseille-P4669]
MQRNRTWLPVLASVGIGAAAYYSMKKGNKMGNVVSKFAPLAGILGGGMGNNSENTQS